MTVAIDVRGLGKRFGATSVLGGLDLRVEPTEHVAITRPNGAGKTTLLRVLAGLLRPTQGSVEVLGGSTRDPRVRRRIGVLGHLPALYARMTPLENLRFWGHLYDDPDAPGRGRDVLARFGLDPDDRRPVGLYSQGMRQRVAIARAWSTGPELVIADEPLAGLDADGVNVVAALLSNVTTTVVATHDPSRLPRSRTFALARGRLDPA